LTVSKLNDLPDETLIAIARWAEVHAADPDAAFRLSRVGRYLDREETGEEARKILLRSSLVVLARAGFGGLSEEDWARFGLGMLCSRVSHMAHNEPAHSTMADFVLAALVATGAVFVRGSRVRAHPGLWIAVRRALEAGFLDIERHARGIEAFVGWLREQEDPDGMIAGFLARTAGAFPSPVWHRDG
jgi:hypothetical protein